MPTGYTAAVQEGIEFNEFVWSCARAFDPLILMRDDPMDAPVPERFEPSDYYSRSIAEKETELRRVEAMTPDEARRAAQADYDKACAYKAEADAKDAQTEQRYREMIAKVEAWQPPTSEHDGLKEFMLQQLNESLKFDCGYKREAPVLLSGAAWQSRQLTELRQSLAYYQEELAKEIKRTEGRNKWLADLRASVPPPTRNPAAQAATT